MTTQAISERTDYPGRTYRKARTLFAWLSGVPAFILLMEIPGTVYTIEKWLYAGLAVFVLLIGAAFTALVRTACKTVSPHMLPEDKEKAVRDRLLWNPFTFILGVICFPLWPFLLVIGAIWLFWAGVKDWKKGNRWGEAMLPNTSVAPMQRCPRCDIRHMGKCPSCGF